MSILDVIPSLFSDQGIVVTRRLTGSFNSDGIWVPGASSTFTIIASIQPATGMQRVVGGRDQRQDELGQHVDDVRAVYTNIKLNTRTPTTEPDRFDYDGGTWIVVRSERWQLNNDTVYRSMATRETKGAS